MKHPLHLALIAIAANPYQVSEGGLGWKSILALAPHHRLTVFTHSNNREEINRYLASDDCDSRLQDVSFVFVARSHGYHPNQAIARMLNWYYYHKWLKECIQEISNLAKFSAFDLVHHVTYSTWRMGSPFHKTGLPTVWGPIGGAGRVPFSAFGILSREARVTEAIRAVLSQFFRLLPAFRDSLNRNTVVLASNQETRSFLQPFSNKEIGIVFPTYFEPEEASREEPACSSNRTSLICFYGGGIIGSKGISMSLEAIAKACERGADIIFKIAGDGPEKPYLQQLAVALGIGNRVEFLPLLSGVAYRAVLDESEVFLFPSFRENIGITMVDAMLHHTAPIVLDTSAPGEIVTHECGWKIQTSHPKQMVTDLSDALLEAYSQRELTAEKGKKSKQRILSMYSEGRYVKQLTDAYAKVLKSGIS